MKKYYLINQPPIVENFSLLVDEIAENKNWGMTNDLDKIEYNRNLIGKDFDVDLEIRQCLSGEGTTTIFNFGRFITVFQLRKDSKKGKMTFFDFETKLTRIEIENILESAYSNNIINAWFNCYDELKKSFTEANDIVILHKPEL